MAKKKHAKPKARRYGKGKSIAGNVARGRKKTQGRQGGHGGKAVKMGIMRMKTFMKAVKKKNLKKNILKALDKAQQHGKGKKPATSKMATERKKRRPRRRMNVNKNIMNMKSMKSMKFMKSVKKNILKDKGAIYTRTSSKTNKHGASIIRQKEAAQRAAAHQQTAIVKTVSEVISGSLTS